jgi:glycerophosphoryl diester phosphodiesterase
MGLEILNERGILYLRQTTKSDKMKFLFSVLIITLWGFDVNAQTTIIAHRGSSFIAPENTVAAAKLAWEQNADAVECDIYLTKDNRIVVMHDGTTKRTTGETYKYAETNSDVLRTLDAGLWKDLKYKGEKIPFLEEIITTAPKGKKVVIEIKCGPEVFPALKQVVNSCKKKKQLVFIAFDWGNILIAKKMFPKNACYWLSSSAADVQAKLPEVAKNRLDGVNLNNKIVDEETVKKAKTLGLEVLSWTIDDPQEAKRLVQLGVSAITTNRPDLIRESLR